MSKGLFRPYRGNDQQTVNEVYLLAHPFYGKESGKYDVDYFRKIWKQSIEKAGTNPDVFGIMYFDGEGKQFGEPYELKFEDDINPDERELGKFFRSVFGKGRTKFVMAGNLYFRGIHRDERLKERLSEPENVTVTARGIWAEICVNDTIDGFCKEYDVPRENGSIVFEESILAEKNLSPTTLKKLGITQEEIEKYPCAAGYKHFT